MQASTSYQQLGPDEIINAVEDHGYRCDARILPLNSYENRVYQIGIEDSTPVIGKFYRPGRWSDDTILEEHAYTLALAEHELPVIAPLADSNGNTLMQTGPFRFAIYPRVGGHPPELDDPEQLLQLGRCFGRLHNIGELESFRHRSPLPDAAHALQVHEYLLEHGFVPAELVPAYESLIRDVVKETERCFERAGAYRSIRLHGDCHLGNVLWHDGPFLVDFDDACMGPAIQDLWMFLSGDRAYMTARLHDLLAGYTEFRDFNPVELHLLEPLRSLRMINYTGWLARRWDDPAFPRAFPWFTDRHFWEEHVLSLREQFAAMQEPPLEWRPD